MSRLGISWFNQFNRIFGSPEERRFSHAALLVERVRSWENRYEDLDEDDIRLWSMKLRGRARGGVSLDTLLPEAMGLACVACQRALGLRPYDVQIAAGIVLHHGALAEVATGEGKTLIAILPAYLNALTGKGVHVTTVNDYLARRDAEWTGPAYHLLGMSIGALQQQMEDDARRHAYGCDITYGTAAEFGFDFLRDRLRVRSQSQGAQPFWSAWQDAFLNQGAPNLKVQREHNYAIVDEADSILVDEARTPLIIATATRLASEEEAAVFYWADKVARTLQIQAHFTFDHKKQKVELTEDGRQRVRWSGLPTGEHAPAMDKLFEHIERAIFAHVRYRRDQHYMIEDDKIVIIDEYTGRRMPDRHWREGLHQAVEAKEGTPITKPTEHAAQITFQTFYKLYKKLAGMTGTANPNGPEFSKVYKLRVVVIPTNRRILREQYTDAVFFDEQSKYQAIVRSVRELHEQGRPVLVGTRSVEKSEAISILLTEAGIKHQVLSARHHEREADVVAQAGRLGAVTIATNMAGRGTDIILGGNPEAMAWAELRDQYESRLDVPREIWHDKVREVEAREGCEEEGQKVREAGGLHVLGTERHDAARVDRQLAGRSGRQGDPGSCQFFLSLEDELLESLGAGGQEAIKDSCKRKSHAELQDLRATFIKAQRKMESRHYRQRVDLMVYERQRQEVLKELGADPYVD